MLCYSSHTRAGYEICLKDPHITHVLLVRTRLIMACLFDGRKVSGRQTQKGKT